MEVGCQNCRTGDASSHSASKGRERRDDGADAIGGCSRMSKASVEIARCTRSRSLPRDGIGRRARCSFAPRANLRVDGGMPGQRQVRQPRNDFHVPRSIGSYLGANAIGGARDTTGIPRCARVHESRYPAMKWCSLPARSCVLRIPEVVDSRAPEVAERATSAGEGVVDPAKNPYQPSSGTLPSAGSKGHGATASQGGSD